MGFLEEHFGKDYSNTSAEELETLKAINEQRAQAAEEENLPIVDSMPVWLNMTNTTRCNLQCIMCNQAYGRIDKIQMEPAIYQQIVREFYPFLRTVQLTAIGEPMMTPQLPSLIDDMLRYGVSLEMVTNGSLMKGDLLLEKLAAAASQVILSLDGATPETFNSIRKGADFTAIINNIERFNHFRLARPEAVRPAIDFNYILMKRNIRELPAFVDLAADLGAREIICFHLVLYDEELQEEMLVHSQDLSDAFLMAAAERARARGLKIRLPPLFKTVDTPATEESPAPESCPHDAVAPTTYQGEKCYFLWRRVYIGPAGEVIPCCLSGIESLGSLKENRFPEIWNNPRYQAFRKKVHTLNPLPYCRDCYLINRNPVAGGFNKVQE